MKKDYTSKVIAIACNADIRTIYGNLFVINLEQCEKLYKQLNDDHGC